MTAKPRIAREPVAHGEALNSPRQFFGVFKYSARALQLLWSTSRKLAFVLGFSTILTGILPSAVAWVGARIVDSVVAATRAHTAGTQVDVMSVLWWGVAQGVV